MKIRIGTRGSKLALWQAETVQKQLQEAGFETEIVTIETKGDKILDVSIAKIGSKGVFTEEIETQLANGTIDIAVHSAKDMQSSLPKGFEIIAFMEREKANDVIVSRDATINLDRDQSFVLGTASTRRVATLAKLYPKIQTKPVRGNLQTRIRKMDEGEADALLLAYAGVHRMGYENMIVQELSLDEFVPAVGQGSVAIEVHDTIDLVKKEGIRKVLNHDITEKCLLAERAFLKTMDGGCSIPVFGMATYENSEITLKGGIVSLDGSQSVERVFKAHEDDFQKLGHDLALDVLSSGGKEILEKIKQDINEN